AADAFLRARLLGHEGDWRRLVYHRTGDRALRHLFTVAAGLDSLLIGESQILGQVRLALAAAESANTAGPILGRAFRAALKVGRRARAETFIGRHPLSISSAAVQVAREQLGGLAD